MKIYYICAVDIANYDAQRTHILEVVSNLHRAGEDITLFLPAFRKERESFPFKTIYIPVILKKSKLKFVEYEVWSFFVLLIYSLLRRPRVIYIRKGFLTIMPGVVSRLLAIKSIIEVNGIIAKEVRVGFNLPNFVAPLFALAEKISYLLTHRVVAVTNGLKTYLAREYRISASKISVISNGVNVERFSPSPTGGSDKHYLGFVGNLVRWAGLEFLIRSIPSVVSEIPHVKYLIVGDGQLRESLEQLSISLQVSEFIEFTGKVTPEDVPSYINRCDICYVPAIRERNAEIGVSPIKLYEYLACGKPVIVTNIAGLDMVEEYRVGMVTEPENPEALAQATLKLLRNPERRRGMAIRARKIVVQQFSWKKTAERVLELCHDLNNSNN